MKKFLLTFPVVFVLQNMKSQVVFCPPGAEWHYTVNVFTPYATYNRAIKYVRDSIVGADTLKVLNCATLYKSYNYFTGSRLTLIRQKGDTVFMKNLTTQNSWQILYNYAATAGQSWTTTIYAMNYTTPTQPLTYTVTVDSVRTSIINNVSLKVLFVKYSGYGGTDTTRITERFGCAQFMFNYHNLEYISDADWFGEFLCYEDDTFGLKQFTEKACDYTNVGIKVNNFSNTIHIYPNPARDDLNIVNDNSNAVDHIVLSLQDITGRTIKEKILQSNTDQIDLNDLSNGVYIITITKDKELLYKTKLVKEH